MIQGRQIVCLSSLQWHAPVTTSRHHLARILGGANEILFVDPPRNLLRHGPGRPGRLLQEESGIKRLEPRPHLPYGGPVRFRITTRLNQLGYARSVEDAVRQLGWARPILWNVWPLYFSPEVARRIRPRVTFLHMTDSLWDYPGYRREGEGIIKRFLADADFALGSTPEITERLSAYGVPAHHLRHGVDVGLFEPVAAGAVAPASAMVNRDRPRLGLVGNIEQRIDLEVLKALCAGPGSVTLVGPCSLPPSEVAELTRSGCHIERPVPYEEIPSWLAGFDIALLPYRRTDLVIRSRPLKLLEYLAAGLPVLSVDIPAARDLAPHVQVVTGPSGFRQCVARLWSEQAERGAHAARQARVAAARPHSWTSRAEELSIWIEEAESRARP